MEGLFVENSTPKIKHETICNDYKGKGLQPEIPSSILSQYLWYNEKIQVEKNSIYKFNSISENSINYDSQLFQTDGFIKAWHDLRTEHKLQENLIHVTPEGWKFIIKKKIHKNTTNLIIHDQRFKSFNFRRSYIYHIYSILISKFQNKPSNICFENLFDGSDTD